MSVGVHPQARGLVDADHADPSDAVRVVNQRGPVVTDRGHHRRPPETERGCDLGHGVSVLPDAPARLDPDAESVEHVEFHGATSFDV